MFKWLSNYRKRTEKENYNNGYDYAAGILLRKELTPQELEKYIIHIDYDSFDRGIVGAINKLDKIGFMKGFLNIYRNGKLWHHQSKI